MAITTYRHCRRHAHTRAINMPSATPMWSGWMADLQQVEQQALDRGRGLARRLALLDEHLSPPAHSRWAITV